MISELLSGCRGGSTCAYLYSLICHDIFTFNSLFQVLIDLNINTWEVQGGGGGCNPCNTLIKPGTDKRD